MKKYTQEEFDNFEVDEYGYKICPSGDYSLISNFGEYCSFGECCSFGEWCSFGKCCSFGERCSLGEHCICEFGEFEKMSKIGGFGRVERTTYFFKLTDGNIGVRCGCFAGNLDEFRKKVKETHGKTKYAKEYLMIADLMEYHFGEE